MPLFVLLTAILAASAPASRAEPAAPEPVKPLAGRCVGTQEKEDPPPGQTPADGLPPSWNEAMRLDFTALGFKPGPDGKTLLAADGVPASKELLAWLAEPEDFSRVKVHSLIYLHLVDLGYDLDEDRCVMSMNVRGTLTRLQYRSILATDLQGRQRSALEQLGARFGDGHGPLPAAARAEKRRFEGILARLPPDLARKIEAGTASRADVVRAYTDAERAFDGSPDSQALAAADLTPTGPDVRAPTLRPEELSLSRALAGELSGVIGQTEYGRQLLDAIKSRGAPLPLFRLQRLAQADGFAGGVFDPRGRKIVLDHDNNVRYLLAGLPEDEQKRLAERLKTPEEVRRYLMEDPAALKKFGLALLGVSFHELTHYFQSLTTHFEEESAAGNAPNGAYPIEYEHEAYRETCAYMSQRALDHEYGAAEWSEVTDQRCQLLLSDYGRFADHVTQTYAKSYGATTMADIRLMQELRRRTAQKLLPVNEVVERLRLSGMLKGDDAIHELTLTIAERTAVFKDKKLPDYRRLAIDRLIQHATTAGRPDVSLVLMAAFPVEAPGMEDALARWVPAAVPAFASPSENFPLAYRVIGYQYAAHTLQKEKRHWPAALLKAYIRDVGEDKDDPNATWAGLGSMAPDQPGLADARAAWSDSAAHALEHPSQKFPLPARFGAFEQIAASYSERKRDWPPELMKALERDLAQSSGHPEVGGFVVSYLSAGQPGRDAAARVWLKTVKEALLSPKPAFSLEVRMVAWSLPGATAAELKPARERDAAAYARVLLDKARAEPDAEKRRSLLKTAAGWAAVAPGTQTLKTEIDKESNR